MHIHITPRIYLPFLVRSCELVSLEIAELGVSLTNKELVTRQPYPNKRIWAGSRRIGRKAIAGVLFDSTEWVPSYTAVTRWSVDDEAPVTHTVRYEVLDRDFGLTTDNMLFWYATTSGGRKWARRWAGWTAELPPAQAQPMMEFFGPGPHALPKRVNREDLLSDRGFISSRDEKFPLHTVELERLLNPYGDRMPTLEAAFQCGPLISSPPYGAMVP